MKKFAVLLEEDEYVRYQGYCKQQGFKKSTLAARLIREHLAREQAIQEPPAAPYAVSANALSTNKQKTRRLAGSGTKQ